ncbi:MAG: hypothetical protein Q9219_006158 [cf. Caloplaca sp. 3 TL-2023]
MSQYVLDMQRGSQSAISDINNMMLLRSDLHKAFDAAKQFVFVPKGHQPGVGNTVIHLISPSEEYGPLYHNTIAYPLDLIPVPYLFARFAWVIFPLVEPFLLRNVRRSLATTTVVQQTYDPNECKEFTVFRSKRSGTGSPKKRPKPTAESVKRPHNETISQGTEDDRSTKRIKRSPTPPGSVENQSAEALEASDAIPSIITRDRDLAPDAPLLSPRSEPRLAAPNDGDFDWGYYHELRERGLQGERQKSDPEGSWLDKINWAMDIFRNEHFAKDIQAWADVDEAHRILGEADDSRDWVKYEDRYKGWNDHSTA